MKPKNKVKIKWSPGLAYIIGLVTTDGNLVKDGRHINFTSKDLQLVKLFRDILGLKNKITIKSSGSLKLKKYFFLQFGDINFYKFLLSIGLTPKKSLTLSAIKVPDIYFFDFLRGHFDGDGTFYSYWDSRWRSSFMLYTVFISASKKHILWLQNEIYKKLCINGHLTKSGNKACYQLKYAKEESAKLIAKIYYRKNLPRLERKYKKVYNALAINYKQQQKYAQVV